MPATRAKTSMSLVRLLLAAMFLFVGPSSVWSQKPPDRKSSDRDRKPPPDLTAEQWKQLDRTVDKGLVFLAGQQEADGSFPTLPHAKPGVTGLCILAFLSRGHLPSEGPYGRHVQRGVDFVLASQRNDGLLTIQKVEPTLTSNGVSHTAMYSHGVAGLMLAEVHGVTGKDPTDPIGKAIVKGLEFSRSRQTKANRPTAIAGGFDYLVPPIYDDGLDLPITSCQLLFYRSAKNAGFDVPADDIDAAMRYVKSCYDPRSRTFIYRNKPTLSRGLTGSGILALSLGGEHQTEMAKEAGTWLLAQPFEPFNTGNPHDRYFYSAYYCSQAMFQLGGEYWSRFYPPLLNVLAKNQRNDGSWNRELNGDTSRYGNSYSSALAILALTPPYQLLPIYQR
jgi:hypothetical protein